MRGGRQRYPGDIDQQDRERLFYGLLAQISQH